MADVATLQLRRDEAVRRARGFAGHASAMLVGGDFGGAAYNYQQAAMHLRKAKRRQAEIDSHAEGGGRL